MSIIEELKSLIGITTTEYDLELIMFSLFIVGYIVKSLMTFLYSLLHYD